MAREVVDNALRQSSVSCKRVSSCSSLNRLVSFAVCSFES